MKSRLTQFIPPSAGRVDVWIGLLLFLAGLYAYTGTLAPTVLEGDAALFQYTPYVLGVTYPTGYPLYILLGKLWLTLLPFGEIAWRMNLLSALCAALALPLLYGAARRLFAAPAQTGWATRWAALAATLIFATLPTYWRWATEAKIYALNLLLFSGVLYTLTGVALQKTTTSQRLIPASQTMLTPWQTLRYRLVDWSDRWPLAGAVLLLGLQLSVHSTTVLLIPGLLLFAWLHVRPLLFTPKRFLSYTLLLMLPGLLYFYVPLRAEWLIAQYTRFDAIGQGLLADFYHSGLAGLVRYFSAADFTGGVVTNWGLAPQQFITVYLPLLGDEFTRSGVALGVAGGLAFALRQPRQFLPLFLIYALPIPFVLTYGQGEQSAFLLPSFLIFSLFAGYLLVFIPQLASRVAGSDPRLGRLAAVTAPLLLLALFPLFLTAQIQHNTLWLSRKWTRSIHTEWADALNHPLEPGAGMLAHWGDLTSFWYMQHAEQRRPDLRGVYPPDEAIVIDWFERGHEALYIAGPLQGWAAGIETRYQLIPWGRLVRIAPHRLEPQQLLPALSHPVNAAFGDKLRLIGVDFAPEAVAGLDYPVMLTWQALAELNQATTVSLRLSRDKVIVAQLDDPLRSGWFPSERLPAGQYLLTYPLLPVPVGILPGEYRFQLVVYEDAKAPWSLADGAVVLDLGPVTVVPPPATYQPDLTPYKTPPAHDFGGEIILLGYDYSVARVGQGKGFALSLLWQARQQPADNYTLLIEQLDAAGQVIRSQTISPVGGQAPTANWQPGQYVRDLVDVVVPASAPPGEAALRLRLSWLRPDGSKLALHRWRLPFGDGLNLDWLQVTEKEGRIFEQPPLDYPVEANLDHKVRLLGYNLPPTSPGLQIEQTACRPTASAACRLNIDLFWQGLAEMEQAYQVFVHVVDQQGQIVTQHDRAPARRGKEPTTGWLPGEVIHDPIDLPLPADIAPGQYAIQVGMYLPPTGPRLPVMAASAPVTSEAVTIGVLEVIAP